MRPRIRQLPVLVLGLAALFGCAPKAKHNAWQPVSLGTDASFNDIWFADDHNGWMVGGGWDIEGGIIGRTHDGGETWRFTTGVVPGVERYEFGAVQFFDSLSGCIVGGDGKILRTDDGGEVWRPVRSGSGGHLSALHFVDRSHGWAAGGAGVLRTEDGGEHWDWAIQGNSENGYVSGEAITFLDHENGWMSGQSVLRKTTDGGETWSTVTLPLAAGESVHLRAVCFPDPRHGWVVGENGTILATSDGGWTWICQRNGIPSPTSRPPQVNRRQNGLDTLPADLDGTPPGLSLTAVRFLDAARGWTVGSFPWEGRSVILRTEDGGATWAEEARVPGEDLRAFFLAAKGRAWSVGDRVRPGRQVMLRRASTAP